MTHPPALPRLKLLGPPIVVAVLYPARHGYLRDWSIVSLPPDRHLGYAFQGFAFAAAVLAVFLILTLRRKKK